MKLRSLSIFIGLTLLLTLGHAANISQAYYTNSTTRRSSFSRNTESGQETVNTNQYQYFEDRPNITYPEFPLIIPYDINVVLIGMNKSWVNESALMSDLPEYSQISRYVPLSFQFETFLDFNINYNLIFAEYKLVQDLSNAIGSLGTFGYTFDMGVYWSLRTSVNYYERLNIQSVRTWLRSNLQNYKDEVGNSLSIQPEVPTVFLTNLFANNSKFYTNDIAIPHVYDLEKSDIDTGLVSGIRDKGRYSPGFGWTDSRWLYLDVSSGPTSYETIDTEFSNYIEHIADPENASDILTPEIQEIVHAAAFAVFLPTYLYEPVWRPNVEICIAIYQNESYSATDYLSINKIRNVFTDLFFTQNVSVSTQSFTLQSGTELDLYLDQINGYSPYSSWAQKLVEYVDLKGIGTFGTFDSSTTVRNYLGIFSMDKIQGKEDAFGYTYADIGMSSTLGSVTTISPATITTVHEGLTQTSIHELGHGFSLRHPHDYRYYGNLRKLWVWDVQETPLSYFHSVYDWDPLTKDVLYRGNSKYLFNASSFLLKEIYAHLESINFPEDVLPEEIYLNLAEIADNMSDAIDHFTSLEYDESLAILSALYMRLVELQTNVVNFPNYIEPLINFETINESVIDYGNDIVISGNIVSYRAPYVSIFNENWNDSVFTESENVLVGRFETPFTTPISSLLYGTPGETINVNVSVYDEVRTYYFQLTFSLVELRVTILSPSSGMAIDLSYSSHLKLLGSYFSLSNTSSVKILYGAYWYVNDRLDNLAYWHEVNKTTGNEWIYTVNQTNLNLFANGDNRIAVKIQNENTEDTDEIEIRLSGLPETSDTSDTETSDTRTPSPSRASPLEEPPWTLMFLGGLFSVLAIGSIRRIVLEKRSINEALSEPFNPDVESSKFTQQVTNRIEEIFGITEKYGTGTRKKGKKEFKPKRRPKSN